MNESLQKDARMLRIPAMSMSEQTSYGTLGLRRGRKQSKGCEQLSTTRWTSGRVAVCAEL